MVCRSLPDPDNTPTASWPCWGPSASPEDSWAPQGPRPGYPFQALSGRQRPLSLLPWNFPCRPCQRLQEYVKKKMFPVRAGLFYGSRGWEADRRVERPCHDAVPSAERLGPCLPPGPSLEALVPSQAKPPFTPVPPRRRHSPAKQRLRVQLGARASQRLFIRQTPALLLHAGVCWGLGTQREQAGTVLSLSGDQDRVGRGATISPGHRAVKGPSD